jgi:hypothetical protein
MVERRYPIYAKADLTVESNDDAHEATIERVIESLKNYIYDYKSILASCMDLEKFARVFLMRKWLSVMYSAFR